MAEAGADNKQRLEIADETSANCAEDMLAVRGASDGSAAFPPPPRLKMTALVEPAKPEPSLSEGSSPGESPKLSSPSDPALGVQAPSGFDGARRRSSVSRFLASIFTERRGSKESIERPASPIDRSPNASPRPGGSSPALSASSDSLPRRRPSENDVLGNRRRPSGILGSLFTPLVPLDGESGGFFSRRGSAMSTTSSVGEEAQGTRLAEYKMLSVLGKGKFSTVKAAIHLPTGKQCAIKLIDKPPQGTNDFIQVRRAYQNECALLASAKDHPNVLQMFAHFETPSKYCIVTEQLGGGELWDRISKSLFRPFEETDGAVHALVIASALAHLHDPARAIVHRDLKSPNLVYRSKPTVGRDRYDKRWDPRSLVIVDFGIGRRWWLKGIEDPPTDMTEDELERENEREAAGPDGLFGKDDSDDEGSGIMMKRFCGSPLWMAPEIVRGQGYGREVDMWSFGVIIYGLLTGMQSPLPGLSATGNDYLPLMRPPRDGIDYPTPPLSPGAVDFLKGLLCWNPKERMTAGMCLQHKWLTDVVGGDWVRWEGLVRKYALETAAQRQAREAAAGGDADEFREWKVNDWDGVISNAM